MKDKYKDHYAKMSSETLVECATSFSSFWASSDSEKDKVALRNELKKRLKVYDKFKEITND